MDFSEALLGCAFDGMNRGQCVWNPLGEVSTTQGGGCQAAEVGDKGWKEGGGAGGSGSPSRCGRPGREAGGPGSEHHSLCSLAVGPWLVHLHFLPLIFPPEQLQSPFMVLPLRDSLALAMDWWVNLYRISHE